MNQNSNRIKQMKMYCMSDVFNYCNNFSKNNYDTKTKYNKLNNIVKELDIHERYLYNIDRNMYKNENINIKIKKRIN